ncbi:LOW QUALITY PROTEIN: uncharacterized protein [Palaemon carinicauda]|uniref:LOW QUALITY PROTEIN: uncharacterized protein n=1 Tax=Palaemon carinicauda TaxID=392227 RepID=UPI0035B5955F
MKYIKVMAKFSICLILFWGGRPRVFLLLLWTLFVTWIVAGNTWAHVEKTPKADSCVPCNSSLDVEEDELPSVGFICPTGFPSSLPPLPFKCLIFFPQNYTLTLHLHEFYLRNASVSVCSMIYYEYMKIFGTSSKLSSEFCWDLHPLENKLWVFGSLDTFYLNITIPTSKKQSVQGYFSHLDFHSSAFGHEAYNHRQGFNFTYEIRSTHSAQEAVEGLNFAHLSDCSFNGVPVLHRLSRSNYKFSCRCLRDTAGEHCEWGGRCRRNGFHLPCSNENSTCRHIDGQDICSCPKGYRGKNCDLHYTTISAIDNSCGGIRDCQHHCHLRILVGQKEAFCSCKAGYTSLNETHCVPSEEWDVLIKVKFPSPFNYTKNMALTKIKQILDDEQIIEGIADTAIKVQMKSQELIFSLDIKGLNLKNHLMEESIWKRQFAGAEVQVSAQPKLTVGPVSAEFDEAGVLLLACPIYGGKILEVSWYKDGYLFYSFNVTECSYEQRTSRLLVVTRKGIADNSCTVILRISDPEVVDRGTFTCRVTDRHYKIERKVIAGINNTLQIELRPYAQSIHQGDNATLECLTMNRGWIDNNHYLGHWKVVPEDGFTRVKTHLLARKGFRLQLFNVTKSLKINCMVKEQEDMDWIPGTRYESAFDTAAIRVITPETLTCPERREYGIQWHLTPVNKTDVISCPQGYKGKATRKCRSHPVDLKPFWEPGNFYSCIYGPLEYIRTQLLLYGRGYKSLERIKNFDFLKDFQNILEEHSASLLPGEGKSILDVFAMFQKGSPDNFVPLFSFFSMIRTLMKQENTLLLMDAWRMVEVIRTYVTGYLKNHQRNSTIIQLPHLAVKFHSFPKTEGKFVWSDMRQNSSSDYSAAEYVRDFAAGSNEEVQLNESSHDEAMKESLDYTQEHNLSFNEHGLQERHLSVEIQMRNSSKGIRPATDASHELLKKTSNVPIYGIGVIVYFQVKAILENSYKGLFENDEVPVLLRNPIVEIITTVTGKLNSSHVKDSLKTSKRIQTDSRNMEDSANVPSVMTSLIYFRSQETPTDIRNSTGKQIAWEARCGKAELRDAKIIWNLTHCELLVSSQETYTCLCPDQGLFTLLLVQSPLISENALENHHGAETKPKSLPPNLITVGLCCALSVLITLATVGLLSPRFQILQIQIHMIKCLGHGAANVLFASVAWWSIERYDAAIMAGISSCLATSIGVGISEQLVLHYHLTNIPRSSFFSTIYLTTTLVFLLSLILGILVWGIQNIQQYPMTSYWMPVGDAWPLSALVIISLLLLATCNTTLFLRNLQWLTQLHFILPDPETTNVFSGQVLHAFALIGELVFICSSFFHSHPVGSFFFSAVSILQSLMLYLEFSCAAECLEPPFCVFLNREKKNQEQDDGEDHEEDNRGKSCMGTLMKRRVPPSDTYAELMVNGNLLDDECSEFRARGGSFWSQSTTILQLSDNGETLQSPTDSIPPLPFDFLDVEAHKSEAVNRPRNLFRRGADFFHGRGSAGAAENVVSTIGNNRFNLKKKSMSFSLHQPVIHEFPMETGPDSLKRKQSVNLRKGEDRSQKYLDMSVTTKPQQFTNTERNDKKKHLYINVSQGSVTQVNKRSKNGLNVRNEIRHSGNITNESTVSPLHIEKTTKGQDLHMAVMNLNPVFSLARCYPPKLATNYRHIEMLLSEKTSNSNDAFLGPIYSLESFLPDKSFSVPDISSLKRNTFRSHLLSTVPLHKSYTNKGKHHKNQSNSWIKESSYHLESLFQWNLLPVDSFCHSNNSGNIVIQNGNQCKEKLTFSSEVSNRYTSCDLPNWIEKCKDREVVPSFYFTNEVSEQMPKGSESHKSLHESKNRKINHLNDCSVMNCSQGKNFKFRSMPHLFKYPFPYDVNREKYDGISVIAKSHLCNTFFWDSHQ